MKLDWCELPEVTHTNHDSFRLYICCVATRLFKWKINSNIDVVNMYLEQVTGLTMTRIELENVLLLRMKTN